MKESVHTVVHAMDYETARDIVHEAAQTNELLVYVAIGCALGRYPEGEHPAQQYPPFLKKFSCRQICILIDPCLEIPPRAIKDVPLSSTVTILPIQAMLVFPSPFLDSLIQLCINPSLRVKMIVQDYTGRDIHPYYPLAYGERLLRNVLFDGDGGCFPDISAMNILQTNGDFIHPRYMRLCTLRTVVPADIVLREFKARRYPIYKLATIHRIFRGTEEPRDWCTEADVVQYFPQYCTIYNIPEQSSQSIRAILIAVVQDLCVFSETYLTQTEMEEIVDSSERRLDTMWKLVESICI